MASSTFKNLASLAAKRLQSQQALDNTKDAIINSVTRAAVAQRYEQYKSDALAASEWTEFYADTKDEIETVADIANIKNAHTRKVVATEKAKNPKYRRPDQPLEFVPYKATVYMRPETFYNLVEFSPDLHRQLDRLGIEYKPLK